VARCDAQQLQAIFTLTVFDDGAQGNIERQLAQLMLDLDFPN